MNLIKLEGDNLIFAISKRDRRLLLDAFKLYPLIPISHLKLTKSGTEAQMKANQRLLEEALAEQRAENKKQVEALLHEEGRFKPAKTGFHLALNQYQAEWLLQVLNDVRVGCWLILGEPDEKKGNQVNLTTENAHHLFIMETCGYFQAILLGAIDR